MNFPEASASIAQRAARGSLALLGRQAITLLVTFVGGILLARLLTPAEFGSYALIVFVAGLTKLLIDGGLAASLIQQKGEPTRADRASVFSFQLVVAVVLAVLLILLAPQLETLLGAVEGTAWSIRLAAIAVLAAPFTSIPFVILERNLDYGMLGMLLIIQPVTFNLIAVWLASANLGVLSLGISLAVSNVLAVPAALWAVREQPPLVFRRGALSGRFRFGLPYIGTNVISTVKDAVNPLYIGVVVGASAAGYVNWAQQVAIIGTYALVVVSRLLFPVFSRVKDNPSALPGAVSKVLFWANMMVAPIAIFLAVFGNELTSAIYGRQWLPAVPLLFFLLLANLLSPTVSVLMALMNALGKPSVSFWFAVAWFAATWALVPVFVNAYGVIGYGYANALIQLVSVALIFIARRDVKFNWGRSLLLPWVYTIVAFAVVVVPARLLMEPLTLVGIISLGVVAVSVLGGLIWLFSRDRLTYLSRAVFGQTGLG